MMMSPDSSFGARSCKVASTTPAGTISHTARGLDSFFTKSSSEEEPMDPSLLSCFTESALRSYTTQLWPFFCRRRTILAPILPRPIMPSCISFAPYRCKWTRLKTLHCQSLLGDSGKFRQVGLYVFTDVNA